MKFKFKGHMRRASVVTGQWAEHACNMNQAIAAPIRVGMWPKGQPSRNAPCPCGSGKKYKKCHGA